MPKPHSYSKRFQTSLLVGENLTGSKKLGKKFLESCVLPQWEAEKIYAGSIINSDSLFSLDHALCLSKLLFSDQESKDFCLRLENSILDLGLIIPSKGRSSTRHPLLPPKIDFKSDLWSFFFSYEDGSVQGNFQVWITRTSESTGILIAHLAETPK